MPTNLLPGANARPPLRLPPILETLSWLEFRRQAPEPQIKLHPVALGATAPVPREDASRIYLGWDTKLRPNHARQRGPTGVDVYASR